MRLKKKVKHYLFKAITKFFPAADDRTKLDISDVKEVLIIRQDNRIGNILFTTSLIELLHDQLGVCPDILVGGKFHDLIKYNPKIRNLLIYDQKKFCKMPWLVLKFLHKLNDPRL